MKIEQTKCQLLYLDDVRKGMRRICDLKRDARTRANMVIKYPAKSIGNSPTINEDFLMEIILNGDARFRNKLYKELYKQNELETLEKFENKEEEEQEEHTSNETPQEPKPSKYDVFSTEELHKMAKDLGLRVSANTSRERIIERLEYIDGDGNE